MPYLKEKQKVLKLFFDRAANNQYNPFDYNPSDVVKMCLTTDLIHKALKYDYQLIDSLCLALKKDGNIAIFYDPQVDPDGIETYYIITPEGKKGHFEKYYLNQSKFRNISFWLSVTAIIISIIALFK